METLEQMFTNATMDQHDRAKTVFSAAMAREPNHRRALAVVYRAGYVAGRLVGRQDAPKQPPRLMSSAEIHFYAKGIVAEFAEARERVIQEGVCQLMDNDPCMSVEEARRIVTEIADNVAKKLARKMDEEAASNE